VSLGIHQQTGNKETGIHTHCGVLFSHKKNEIMSFTGKWMGLEMLEEQARLRKINTMGFFSPVT
jgi:hypothetical protein